MQPKPLVLPQGGFGKNRPNKHRAVLIWQDRVSGILWTLSDAPGFKVYAITITLDSFYKQPGSNPGKIK